MNPSQAVQRLVAKGVSQADIARIITKGGVDVSQATISRMANDKFDDVSYKLGAAVIALCKRRRA